MNSFDIFIVGELGLENLFFVSLFFNFCYFERRFKLLWVEVIDYEYMN